MNCPKCANNEPSQHADRSAVGVCLSCGFTFDPIHYMSSLRDGLLRDHSFGLL